MIRGAWLFSARVDLVVFLGSAALSLLLLPVGAAAGVLHGDTPSWAWIPFVLMIDVAHVWSTTYRVYLDPEERKRRPWLYALVPLAGYVVGVALYARGDLVFWRALAYVAVFHFVRQQWGWVAMYRARAGETDRVGRIVDAAAVYMAAIYPLIHWHANLPRQFHWFLDGDFAALPAVTERIAFWIWVASLAAYAARTSARWWAGHGNLGKDVVVVTTAVCWYVGIVAFDSDYAFTVTNVVIHGVPYFALVYLYGRRRNVPALSGGVWMFLVPLWAIAFVEEMLWDRGVWHDRGWLFGDGWDLGWWRALVVPLLALPQITHYVLDGFIWRRRTNPHVETWIHAASPGDARRAR